MLMKKHLNKRRKGYSIIEIMVVVAIIGVLVAIALQFVPKLTASTRAKGEIDNINFLVQHIQSVYANQSSYKDLQDNASSVAKVLFIDSGVAPASMISGTSTLVNKFGQSYTFKGANTVSGTSNNAFTIVINGVPKLECSTILNSFANKAIKMGSGTSVNNIQDLTSNKAATPTTIAKGCVANTQNLQLTFE